MVHRGRVDAVLPQIGGRVYDGAPPIRGARPAGRLDGFRLVPRLQRVEPRGRSAGFSSRYCYASVPHPALIAVRGLDVVVVITPSEAQQSQRVRGTHDGKYLVGSSRAAAKVEVHRGDRSLAGRSSRNCRGQCNQQIETGGAHATSST